MTCEGEKNLMYEISILHKKSICKNHPIKAGTIVNSARLSFIVLINLFINTKGVYYKIT